MCEPYGLSFVCIKVNKKWKRTTKQLKIIDIRGKALSGERDWVRNDMELAEHTGKLKAVDFVRLSRDRGTSAYLFEGVFQPGEESLEKALGALLDALVLSMKIVCDVDGKPPTAAMKAKFSKHAADMALFLAMFEKEAPETFSDVLLHELLHVPHAVMRWGHIRNFWCFFGERYVGWITNFINQRNHPSASMANGYSRFGFVRRIDPDTRDRLHRRLLASKVNLAMRGFLVPTEDLLAKRGPGKGAGRLQLTPNWRNSRVMKKDDPLRGELTCFMKERHAGGDVPRLTLVPEEVRILKSGVEVDGVSWKVGTTGLFMDHDDGTTAYGEVTELLLWQEEEEETAILRVKTHKIVSEENGMISVRTKSKRYGVLFLWHNITYKCKKVMHVGNDPKLQTVLRVVATHAAVELV